MNIWNPLFLCEREAEKRLLATHLWDRITDIPSLPSTGMKCIPVSKLPSAHGTILHDWHAEVLAIRALNHFLLEECKAILAEARPSLYLRRRTDDDDDDADPSAGACQQPPFVWRDGVSLHMYCSEAPCGDASMELTISAQADAAPWAAPLPRHLMERNGLTFPPPSDGTETTPDLLLLGRACFDHLGVVRRKPARPDAPPTLSKSCSDKLALRQCTSLLGSAASLLVGPRGLYLESLVLPASQFSQTACERCFSSRGRMAGLVANVGGGGETKRRWGSGYQFRPFEVRTTELEFAFSRRAGGDGPGTKHVASNIATAWSVNGLAESIVGGVLQGRKQTDPRGGSAVCRRRMWSLVKEVATMAGAHGAAAASEVDSYRELKACEPLADRRQVKEDVRADVLKGWVRNAGDEGFKWSYENQDT